MENHKCKQYPVRLVIASLGNIGIPLDKSIGYSWQVEDYISVPPSALHSIDSFKDRNFRIIENLRSHIEILEESVRKFYRCRMMKQLE